MQLHTWRNLFSRSVADTATIRCNCTHASNLKTRLIRLHDDHGGWWLAPHKATIRSGSQLHVDRCCQQFPVLQREHTQSRRVILLTHFCKQSACASHVSCRCINVWKDILVLEEVFVRGLKTHGGTVLLNLSSIRRPEAHGTSPRSPLSAVSAAVSE